MGVKKVAVIHFVLATDTRHDAPAVPPQPVHPPWNVPAPTPIAIPRVSVEGSRGRPDDGEDYAAVVQIVR